MFRITVKHYPEPIFIIKIPNLNGKKESTFYFKKKRRLQC